jgi:hypothetical protein
MPSQSTRWIVAMALVLVAAAGCGRTKQEATTTTSNDSLVAANPQEQTQGNITPQTNYQPPPEQASTPRATTPAPRTRPRTTPHTNPPPHGGGSSGSSSGGTSQAPGITVPSGTPVAVTVNTLISSETAKVGDTWTGVVKDPVMVDGRTVIPAGSTVTGTVTAVTPAVKGSRASLDMAMSSVEVNGRSYDLHGGTEAIVAGSTRARNLGAIAGGAAAGALIGRAVGGSGKGALIGGLIGGAAAGGAVAKSKGYQVVLKEGTPLTFTTTESVSIRS